MCYNCNSDHSSVIQPNQPSALECGTIATLYKSINH